MLDSRGYNRIQIASQAIEAYLIQVKTLFLPYHTMSCMPLILISVFQFPASISSDTFMPILILEIFLLVWMKQYSSIMILE
jgi:hypothetical protein